MRTGYFLGGKSHNMPYKILSERNEYRRKHYKENPEYYKKWRDEHKEYQRKANLKFHHRLTIEQYNKIHKEQGHICAICLNPETKIQRGVMNNLAVDHNHKTGKIRGLLCMKCNRGIGYFRDNRLFLENAQRYLEKAEEIEITESIKIETILEKSRGISHEECVRLLNKWPINYIPEYRRFTCAGCGKNIIKAWHIHCLEGGYKREFHLCRKCGEGYSLWP